jgi:molecular chaperone DnaK (HSP70)
MEPRHEWFKLGLYPTAERKGLGKEYPSKSTLSPQSPEEYEKLVIDYLTDLRKHAEDIMRITYGDRLLSRMSMEYIITVPAVWDDKPQSKTQYCAQKAGMGNHVQIITEPEAAGIYALASFPTIGLKQNDTFILCDAGGG